MVDFNKLLAADQAPAPPPGGVDGLVASLVRVAGERNAVVFLLSALNAADVLAPEGSSAGGFMMSGSGMSLRAGLGAAFPDGSRAGRLAGVEFRERVAQDPPAGQLARLAEYLDICGDVPSLTVAQYFDEVLGPAAAAPAGPDPAPTAPPEAAKGDAAFAIAVDEEAIRAAVDGVLSGRTVRPGRDDPPLWAVLDEVEPGLWFHYELRWTDDEWYMDADPSLDWEGRKLAADAPVHRGGKVLAQFKFFESQRWVTVDVAGAPPGPGEEG